MTTASALVLSHLFPNEANPLNGPFVADQLESLAKDHRLTVIAPVRWVPALPISTWRKERRVPSNETWFESIDVFRPRVPQLPFGGLSVEARLLAKRVRPLVARVVRERDVRLLHAHFALPDGFAAAQLARELRLPFVLTLHGSDILVFGRDPRLRPLVAKAVRAASWVVAVSPELAEQARKLGAAPDAVITTPVGVRSRHNAHLTKSAARHRLGLAADERWILWVGGLVAVKQPEHAVAAFARVRSRFRNARLALAGDGPLRGEIARLVARDELGASVRLLGRLNRDEVRCWQAAADVMCNSSRSEGTPVAVLESLLAGTPVAAYPVGGIPGAIESTRGGTLASDRTPAALADALTKELSRRRGRAELIAAAKPFTLEEAIQPLRRVYDEALDG